MKNKRCAIFGFGYLGRPLAEKLHQSGWQLAAVKRSLTSDDINLPLDLRAADMNGSDELQTAFRDWRGFDCWVFLLPPSSVEDYVGSVRQWAEAAQEGKIGHLVLASSISVYGSRSRLCDEYSLPEAETRSAQKIVAAEEIVRGSSVPNRDIFRLGGLYCAQRHPLSRLIGRSQIVGGRQRVNMLHRERAVNSLAYGAEHADGLRIRNLVENRHPSRAEFYAAEAAKFGLPAPEFLDDGGEGKTVCTAYTDFADYLAV
ncbi:MAG: SDR family NAD(P)-dependent oxidoreductase [Neisseria sp.]|nr:SDR family NAD(P)-dependent oxidoreductase [Neisseria sp.]